jgi:ATP-binding protein involved in chromosome partitioning
MWERVQVPILGVVENMSYLLNPVNGEKINLFPKGELKSYMDGKRLKLLGEVPFNPSVGLACEAGIPIVESSPSSAETESFLAIAQNIIQN